MSAGDTVNVKKARICFIHFLTNDFERNLKREILDYHPTNARKLKDTDVPTCKIWVQLWVTRAMWVTIFISWSV